MFRYLLFILTLLFAVSAFAQVAPDTIIWYTQSSTVKPTQTTSSYAYGVDPREWDFTKCNWVVWYNAEATNDSAHGWSNLWPGTKVGEGDWGLRTGEPYQYWYTSAGYKAYDWQDTVIRRATRAGAKPILGLGGMWGAPAQAMHDYVFVSQAHIRQYVDWFVAYAKAKGYKGWEIDYEWQAASAPTKENVSYFITYARQKWPDAIAIWTTYRTPSSLLDQAVFKATHTVVMTMHYGYGGVKPLGHHAPVYLSSFYPPTWSESWDTDGLPKWINAGWTGDDVGVLLTFEMKSSSPATYGVTDWTNKWSNFENYQVVMDSVRLLGLTVQRDVTAGNVPYIVTPRQKTYTFDDSTSFAFKINYIRNKTPMPSGRGRKIGIWDINRGVRSRPGERKFELIDAVYNIVRNGATLPPPPPPPPVPACDTSGAYIRGYAAGRATCPDTTGTAQFYFKKGWDAYRAQLPDSTIVPAFKIKTYKP